MVDFAAAAGLERRYLAAADAVIQPETSGDAPVAAAAVVTVLAVAVVPVMAAAPVAASDHETELC